jgi:hypothetical protein
MKDRGVSEEEVGQVLEQPDFTEQSIKERMNFYKYLNGRYLRVTVKETVRQRLIITVTIRRRPFKGENHENRI